MEDKVVDSRISKDGTSIRRRRECLRCGRRFTTYEYIEEVPLMVIKKDGRREPFDRKKILNGLLKACSKRPISMKRLEEFINEIEKKILACADREIPSSKIGELIMQGLKELDEVAYVRFASVYRQFKDINEFMKELKDLLGEKK